MDIHGEWRRIELVLAVAVTTKAIWRSRYGKGRAVVMIMTATAATMVGRMAGMKDEVLGSQEDIESLNIFLAK